MPARIAACGNDQTKTKQKESNTLEILQLRERRLSLVKEAQSILTSAPAEGMSVEDEKRFDGLMGDADRVKGQIEKYEEARAIEKELGEPVRRATKPSADNRDDSPEARDAEDKVAAGAFSTYLRFGMGALSGEQRAVMQKRAAAASPEMRSLAEGTGANGGFLVPQDFYRKLTEAQKFYGGVRQSGATVLQTSTGAAMPFPSVNDTANMGAIIGENTQVTETDMGFGSVTLGSYTYTSKIVTVPLNLVQDSAFDLDSYLARALGIRIGRIQNNHFTVGTGASQPRGVTIDAVSGKVGLVGQTLTVIYDDLVDLEHAVDPAYRNLPSVKFMLHDSSLKVIKKLKDSTGRPLWKAGLEGMGERFPDTINGYPYVINNDMAVMAANAKSILFGDFSNYIVRDVLGVQIMRLTERYADFLQVGYLAFARADGALIDAGTHPVAFYANSAT